MTITPSLLPNPAPPIDIPFWVAFRYWLLLGFINFGGPAGQIALMYRDLVERRTWISESRFLHALNFCMLLPGPEAQQLAIYIGWLLHGTWGGIVAGVCFVLPSIFVLLALSYVYAAYGSISIIAGLFAGLKPVIVAIVMEAGFKIGKRALIRPLHLWTAGIKFLAIFIFTIPFPLIIVVAGLVGWGVARTRPEIFTSSNTNQDGNTNKTASILKCLQSKPLRNVLFLYSSDSGSSPFLSSLCYRVLTVSFHKSISFLPRLPLSPLEGPMPCWLISANLPSIPMDGSRTDK